MVRTGGGEPEQVIGVGLDRAAQIVGVDRARLIGWGKQGLVSPRTKVTISGTFRWIYGVDDLVAASIVREIEAKGVHVLRIANAVRQHRSDEHPNPLASMRWGVDEIGRLYVAHEDGWFDTKKHGQGVIVGIVSPEEIRVQVIRKARERVGKKGQIVTERRKRASKPVFAGTRVAVATVQGWIGSGASDERILEAYPMLSPADLRAARRGMRQAG